MQKMTQVHFKIYGKKDFVKGLNLDKMKGIKQLKYLVQLW